MTLACPYCAQPAELMLSSAPLYRGIDYGPVWICRPCQAWVGCHPETTNPLGRLANAALRRAKMAAHAAFDPLFKSGRMKRGEAYAWLAKALGIEKTACHIGMMDEAQCIKVKAVCDQWWQENGR